MKVHPKYALSVSVEVIGTWKEGQVRPKYYFAKKFHTKKVMNDFLGRIKKLLKEEVE